MRGCGEVDGYIQVDPLENMNVLDEDGQEQELFYFES